MKNLTVGELKKLIAHLPDETLVLIDGYEGEYDVPKVDACQVINVRYAPYSVYFGDYEKDANGIPAIYLSR